MLWSGLRYNKLLNGFSEYLSSLFGVKRASEDLSGQVRDSDIFFNSGYWNSYQYLFRDKLYDTYAITDPVKITYDYCQIINALIREEPVISACFQKHVTFADTEVDVFEIKGGDVEQVLKFLRTGIYYRNSVRDILSFVVQNILLYGFMAGVIRTTQAGEIDRLVIPQPWTIGHRRENGDRWVPTWKNSGLGETVLDDRIFVYEATMTGQLNEGIYPIPIMKAALMPAINYQLFQNSLKDISRRTGMQKILGMRIGSAEKDLANLGMNQLQKAEYRKQKQQILRETSERMKQSLPNGMIVYDGEVDIHEISTIEPPSTLTAMADLLSNQVILGAKMFPAFVGASTRENQTTLTDNQKLSIKSLTTSIQASSHRWLKQMIVKFYAMNQTVIDYDDIVISQKPPELNELPVVPIESSRDPNATIGRNSQDEGGDRSARGESGTGSASNQSDESTDSN